MGHWTATGNDGSVLHVEDLIVVSGFPAIERFAVEQAMPLAVVGDHWRDEEQGKYDAAVDRR